METPAIVSQLLTAWNSGDVRRIAALYSPDIVMHHPLAPQPLVGRAAVEQLEAGLFQAFSGIEWSHTNVVAQGNKVAVEVRVIATNTAPMPGPGGMIPATNRRIDLRIGSFLRLTADGLIAEEHRYFDTGSMFAQLGLK